MDVAVDDSAETKFSFGIAHTPTEDCCENVGGVRSGVGSVPLCLAASHPAKISLHANWKTVGLS